MTSGLYDIYCCIYLNGSDIEQKLELRRQFRMKTIVFSDGHRDTNTNVKIVQQQKQAGKEENKQKNTCDFCLQ